MDSPVPSHEWGYWVHGQNDGWTFRQPGDDAMTPLFDEVWEEIMGKHFDDDDSGVADHAEQENEDPRRFVRDDDSVYVRVDPAEFEQAA